MWFCSSLFWFNQVHILPCLAPSATSHLPPIASVLFFLAANFLGMLLLMSLRHLYPYWHVAFRCGAHLFRETRGRTPTVGVEVVDERDLGQNTATALNGSTWPRAWVCLLASG
jgi:hypothetical protein